MKAITTEKVFLFNDRMGEVWEHVQIDLRVVNRDPDTRTVYLEAIDSIVYNLDTPEESTSILRNRNGDYDPTKYSVSFAEYDQQAESLKAIYADDIADMPSDEVEGYLLQQRLLYNLQAQPIYSNKWKAR